MIGGSSGWSGIAADIEKSVAGSSLTVNLNGSSEIPAAVLTAVGKSKATVEFKVSDKASWVVNGVNISGAVSSVNAGVTVGGSSIPESVVNTAVKGLNIVQVAFDKTGKLGIDMSLKVNLGKTYAGNFANVYRVSGNSLEFSKVCVINSDGAAVLPVDTAENYVIVVDDISRMSGDIDNNMVVNVLDASAILKHAVGKNIINDKKLQFADFNNDGRINVSDASAILKYAVGA
jgi:hypothetical protein